LCLALSRVLSKFIEAALDSQRIRNLSSMRSHGAIIEQRGLTAARATGVVLWLTAAISSFSLIDPLRQLFDWVFGSAAHVGSWTLSLGDVASFFLTMYLATKLAQLTGFLLEEDILPRMNLGRGVPATVRRLSGYTVIALGFIFAVGAAGVDMSRVALLASALSVGIGFGLQNEVNNFVSGLMLIFERPVRVGDTVHVGDMIGDVRSIGIRASTLRTFQGAEVIVPNADFISSRVVNWTLSDFSRRVEFPVGVAYGSEPRAVQALITTAVQDVEGLSQHPAPDCLFIGFGDSSLNFEVRIWVRRTDDWPLVRSRALLAIHDKLLEAGIEIPFPQRDLHVRSVDADAAQALAAGAASGAKSTREA
jgi:small-conductance mechanosensitive channel